MGFRIGSCMSVVCVMIMVFGLLVVSTDDCGKALAEKMFAKGKEAKLEKCDNQEINTLMTDFMNARQAVDMKKLEECVDDISQYNANNIKQMQRLVKGVNVVQCYTMEGWEEGTYVVFVEYNTTVDKVQSQIPNLVRDFVTKDESGKYRVKTKIQKKKEPKAIRYVLGTQENDNVKDLIKSVDDKITKVKQEDTAAKTYFDTIESLAKKNKEKKQKEKDADKEKQEDKKQEENKQETAQPTDNAEENKEQGNADGQKQEEQKSEEQKADENNTGQPPQDENKEQQGSEGQN